VHPNPQAFLPCCAVETQPHQQAAQQHTMTCIRPTTGVCADHTVWDIPHLQTAAPQQFIVGAAHQLRPPQQTQRSWGR
jgi:hypothetical protein